MTAVPAFSFCSAGKELFELHAIACPWPGLRGAKVSRHLASFRRSHFVLPPMPAHASLRAPSFASTRPTLASFQLAARACRADLAAVDLLPAQRYRTGLLLNRLSNLPETLKPEGRGL